MKQYTHYLMTTYGFSQSEAIQIENAYIIIRNACITNFTIDDLVKAIKHD